MCRDACDINARWECSSLDEGQSEIVQCNGAVWTAGPVPVLGPVAYCLTEEDRGFGPDGGLTKPKRDHHPLCLDGHCPSAHSIA